MLVSSSDATHSSRDSLLLINLFRLQIPSSLGGLLLVNDCRLILLCTYYALRERIRSGNPFQRRESKGPLKRLGVAVRISSFSQGRNISKELKWMALRLEIAFSPCRREEEAQKVDRQSPIKSSGRNIPEKMKSGLRW